MTRGSHDATVGGHGADLPVVPGRPHPAVVEALSPSGRPADNEPSPCSGTENP